MRKNYQNFKPIFFQTLTILLVLLGRNAYSEYKITQIDQRRMLVIGSGTNSFVVDQIFIAEIGNTSCNLKVIKSNGNQAYLDPYHCEVSLFKPGTIIKLASTSEQANSSSKNPPAEDAQRTKKHVDFENKNGYFMLNIAPVISLSGNNLGLDDGFSFLGAEVSYYFPSKTSGLIYGAGLGFHAHSFENIDLDLIELISLNLHMGTVYYFSKKNTQGFFGRLDLGLRFLEYYNTPILITSTDLEVIKQETSFKYGVGAGYSLLIGSDAVGSIQILYSGPLGGDLKVSTTQLLLGVTL